MIPVKLTLEGIYSYRERQTIDFTRLAGAKLFGIFGPVGSGKSTILEAMIYVLYGTIDRLNTEVKYNLMNLQADRLFVDFEFTAGIDGERYRATVESKRNRKNFMDVSSPKFSYYLWTEEWRPITREEVIDVIGLTVQNFKRVVIIPQGKFQDFLMLRDKERTEMMMELFGDLRQYDLSDSVASLETDTRQKVIDYRGQLVGLGEVSVELLEEEKRKRKERKEKEEHLKEEIRSLRVREEKLKEIKQLFEELTVKTELERQLTASQPEIDLLRDHLKEYEYCLQHFQQLMGNREDLQRRLERVKSDLRELQEKKQIQKKAMEAFTGEFERLSKAYDGREEEKKEIDRLEAYIRKKEVEKEQLDLLERKIKGGEIVVKTRQEMEMLQEELKRQKCALEGILQTIPDMKQLSDMREWFSVRQHLAADQERISREVKKLEEEKEGIIVDYSELRNRYTILQEKQEIDGEQWVKACRERLEALDVRLKALRLEALQLGTRERLTAFARDLSEGVPCPLCGALSHPAPLHTGEVEGELKENAASIVLLEKEEKDLSVVISRLTLLNERYRSCRERELQSGSALKETEKSLEKHRKLFVWKGFSPEDPEKIAEEMKRAETLKAERENTEKSVARTGDKIELQRSNLEKYKLRLEEIGRLLVQTATQIELLDEWVEGLDAGRYEGVTSEFLVRELDRKRKDLEWLEKEYLLGAEKKRQLELSGRKLEGSMEEKERELLRLEKEQSEVHSRLTTLLEGTVYSTLEEVDRVLNMTINIPETHEKINQYNQQLHAVRLRKTELAGRLEGVSCKESEHTTLRQELTERLDDERNLLAEIGALENHIVDSEKRLAMWGKIQKELILLEARLQNLQLLRGLFRGNDFVKFVSSIYLQNLCNAANERFFRMTRQRLKLELSEDNDFLVRDFMNEGRTRSARTLSGGQIFQASLSLALALTDNIRQLSGSKQNFFFLDEGFGSLDKDSLAVVFDTLKALRDENRIVGLISHVEEMQQEVSVCIQVENTSERGTIVTQK